MWKVGQSSCRDIKGKFLSLWFIRRLNPFNIQHATQARSSKQRFKEGRHQGKGRPIHRQEKEEEEEGILQHLHLQSLETGAPRHRCLQQSHVHHEQLCQRHLRENRR